MIASVDLLNEVINKTKSRAILFTDESTMKKIIGNIKACIEHILLQLLEEDKKSDVDDKEANDTFLIALFWPKVKPVQFENYGYKFLITLGSIGSDFARAQTLVGDSHSIKLIVDWALRKKYYKPINSDHYTKWGLWCLLVRLFSMTCYA